MLGSKVEQVVGTPNLVVQNQYGETDYRYIGLSVRLSAPEMRVVEVGICHPRDVVIENIDILRSQTALRDLRRLDDDLYKCAGFVILPNLGFALQGFLTTTIEDRVLTVFSRERWRHVQRRFILSPWSKRLWKRMLRPPIQQ